MPKQITVNLPTMATYPTIGNPHQPFAVSAEIFWKDIAVLAPELGLWATQANEIAKEITGQSLAAQTAANQALAARDNLPSNMSSNLAMVFRENLRENVNLDSKIIKGFYGQPSNARAGTGLNYPVSRAGVLEVTVNAISGYMVFQKYTTYSTNSIYVRSLYSGVWTPWAEVSTENSISRMMNIIQHVDSDIGDNNNSGKDISEPVKTIAQAINNCPEMGRVTVILNGAASHDIGEQITIVGKTVLLWGNDSLPIVQNIDNPNSTLPGHIRMDRGNGLVYVYKCHMKTHVTNTYPVIYVVAGTGTINAYASTVEILEGDFVFAYSGLANIIMNIHSTSVKRPNSDQKLIQAYFNNIQFNIYTSTIEGNTTDYKDLVYSVRKDTNGGYKNILSNNTF